MLANFQINYMMATKLKQLFILIILSIILQVNEQAYFPSYCSLDTVNYKLEKLLQDKDRVSEYLGLDILESQLLFNKDLPFNFEYERFCLMKNLISIISDTTKVDLQGSCLRCAKITTGDLAFLSLYKMESFSFEYALGFPWKSQGQFSKEIRLPKNIIHYLELDRIKMQRQYQEYFFQDKRKEYQNGKSVVYKQA